MEEGKVQTTAEATGSLDQVFDLQDTIVASFLANMNLPLSDQEKALLAAKPTKSPEAFQLYSRAMDTNTPEGKALSDEQRIALLDQSTQIDPDFAMAFISLGDIYFQTRHDYDRAAVYYDKAVVLRPHVVAPRARLLKVYQVQGNKVALQHQHEKILEIRRHPPLHQLPPDKQRFLEDRQRRASIKFQEQQKAHELQRQRAIHEQQKAHELQKQRAIQEKQKAHELQKQRTIQQRPNVREMQRPGVLQKQRPVQHPQIRPPAPPKRPASPPPRYEKKKTR